MTMFQRTGTSNMPQEAAGNRVGLGVTFEECCLQVFEGVYFSCGITST